jgi:hypothetical protein
MAAESIYTVKPRGIVVIGNLSELNSREKRNSFEQFRNNLSNPEVITYDELYERARYIVEGDTPVVGESEPASINLDEIDF